jgi:hypothetical protein
MLQWIPCLFSPVKTVGRKKLNIILASISAMNIREFLFENKPAKCQEAGPELSSLLWLDFEFRGGKVVARGGWRRQPA